MPARSVLSGDLCRLEPFERATHALGLFEAFGDSGDLWTYMPYGPFDSAGDLASTYSTLDQLDDWLVYVIVVNEQPQGVACYLRIDPPNGSIEVGGITYSSVLQRTAAATEAMFLMGENAFRMGYRRYEWKCDDLNAASRRAAGRLGFTYEGTFRQATMYKGRNRDTAWYSIIDSEWPALRAEYVRWLDAANFDESGRQLSRLGSQ